MALVKVDKDTWVNSDHVIALHDRYPQVVIQLIDNLVHHMPEGVTLDETAKRIIVGSQGPTVIVKENPK